MHVTTIKNIFIRTNTNVKELTTIPQQISLKNTMADKDV